MNAESLRAQIELIVFHTIGCAVAGQDRGPSWAADRIMSLLTTGRPAASIYLDHVAEKAAVKALGDDIGFGRVIQLAHQCWDEMLEADHGIKGHSEAWTLAAADLIREQRLAKAEGR